MDCLVKKASKMFGSNVFWLCDNSIEWHKNDDYESFKSSGFFQLRQKKLYYYNTNHFVSEINLFSGKLTKPNTKTEHMPINHDMHVIYLLGANSTFEHKSWDWKLFAMTGVTIHGGNYPKNEKFAFGDLVRFGVRIVEDLIDSESVKPQNIIVYGDSFGGATAEAVFQHFVSQSIYLAGRIVSNSFISLEEVFKDIQHKDPTKVFGLALGACLKPLILPTWNARPLATADTYTDQLFLSNRLDDRLLSQSQLTRHATNKLGLLNPERVKAMQKRYNLPTLDIFDQSFDDAFSKIHSPYYSPTLTLLIWASRVLTHHQELELRKTTSSERRREIHDDSHCAMYTECDPTVALASTEERKSIHRDSDRLKTYEPGPHNTELMLSSVITIFKFQQAATIIDNHLAPISKNSDRKVFWKSAWRSYRDYKIAHGEEQNCFRNWRKHMFFSLHSHQKTSNYYEASKGGAL